MKLNVKACAVTFVVAWECVIVWSFILAMIGKGTAPFELVNQLYFSLLSPTWSGLALGVVIGFLDALIGGAFFAWLYNRLAKRGSTLSA